MRNTQSIFLSLVVGLMGVGMLVLGYLIEFQKKIVLIAGNEQNAQNLKGLGHFVGYTLLGLGTFELVMAFLLIFLPSRLKGLLLTLAVVDLVGILGLVLGMKSF